MPEQLSLLLVPPSTDSTGLPTVVGDILHAARGVPFSTRIVRGTWGIGLGPKRKWILTGDCCCALAAFLVAKGAEAERHENSPRATAGRLLGLHGGEIEEFVRGYDDLPGPKTQWREYGQRVARELEVQ